jgi:hypothetical protein
MLCLIVFQNLVSWKRHKIYPKSNDEDKASIEEAIIKYMVNFNTSLDKIQDQLFDALKNVLIVKRRGYWRRCEDKGIFLRKD